MAISEVGGFTSTRGALEEALLDQVGLIDLLDRAGIFAQSRSDRREPYGTTSELVDDHPKELIVDIV